MDPLKKNTSGPVPIQTLSIIVPCYNESNHVNRFLDRLTSVNVELALSKQIIVVDDGSTDGTGDLLQRYLSDNPGHSIHLIQLPQNRGKGYSIRTALPFVKGEVVVIQDADMEYNPEDLGLLLRPLVTGETDVAFGSRFKGSGPHKGPFILHKLVNKVYTRLSNFLTGLHLSDIHTCYKMFRTEILRNIPTRENRFGFDPEVVARLSQIPGIRIMEVGISYTGRTFAEGKKINIGDGIRAFWCILRYNFIKP